MSHPEQPDQTVPSQETAQIVDRGRGPQLWTGRITVLDVFYYLRRGYDFDFIRRAMPSLTAEGFAAITAYVSEHQASLEEQDARAEEWHRRGIEAQHAQGGILAAMNDRISLRETASAFLNEFRRMLAIGKKGNACLGSSELTQLMGLRAR